MKGDYILGLDISTTTIGIVIYEDMGDHGELKLLHHVSPKIKPLPSTKMEELFMKADVFENEFLNKYIDFGIKKVIIEEPLLNSNNVNTIATLLRFNGILSRMIYKNLGIVPDFVSSYEARKYAFPELMQVRTHDKKGVPYPANKIAKAEPVLFGAYPWDVDKKLVIWEKVAELEPQVTWLYNKKMLLTKENFDMSDAVCVAQAYMKKEGHWS